MIQQEKESFNQQSRLKFQEKTSKVLHLGHSFVWCRNWTLTKADQKYLGSFEMWRWRRMEKIGCTSHVRNEVLQRVKEEKNIL